MRISGALEAEGAGHVDDAEVDSRSCWIIRVDGEAHAQKLDVSFDEQGGILIDFTRGVHFGADIEAHGGVALGPLQGAAQQLVLQRLLVTGEVDLERSSGGGEAGLGFAEGGEGLSAGFRGGTRQGGHIEFVARQVDGERTYSTDSFEIAQAEGVVSAVAVTTNSEQIVSSECVTSVGANAVLCFESDRSSDLVACAA